MGALIRFGAKWSPKFLLSTLVLSLELKKEKKKYVERCKNKLDPRVFFSRHLYLNSFIGKNPYLREAAVNSFYFCVCVWQQNLVHGKI